MARIWATLPGTPLLLPAKKKKTEAIPQVNFPKAEGVVAVPVSPFPFPRGPSATVSHLEVLPTWRSPGDSQKPTARGAISLHSLKGRGGLWV